MSYEHILVDIDEGVATLTLNRPDKLNAMNRKLSAELHDAIKGMDADDAMGCIVVTGAGTARFPPAVTSTSSVRTIEDTRRNSWMRCGRGEATKSAPAPSPPSA